MGLRPAWRRRATGDPRRGGGWSLPLALLGFAVAAELAGEPARQALRYSRGAIADGEFWRLVSGHLAHLGWAHLLMNALALAAVWALVGGNLGKVRWLLVAALTIAGIDAGFWWLDTQLDWYVGMSGLLHGLLAAGLLAAPAERRGEALLLAALLAAKLVYEQLAGPLPGSAETAGGTVVVNAHLYGAIAGAAAALPLGGKVALWPASGRSGSPGQQHARRDNDPD